MKLEITPTTVFVYGTLKRGQSNHHLLKDAEYLGDDCIEGKLFDLGGFPAAHWDGVDMIVGEKFEIKDQKTLERLDMLEGHPDFYNRRVVKTKTGQDVWTYFLPKVAQYNAKYLPEGFWSRRPRG